VAVRGGRLVRRIGVVVVLGALALEAALQAASLLAPLVDRAPETASRPGAIRILLVGDSHAAGAGVPRDQRLSDHLERILSARHPGREFQVVNLGRAGVNSAYVANRLDANLLAYRPQALIVWVGVNDLWNTLETESWATSERWLALRRLMLHSKVYRLLTVLWHTRGDGEPAAAHRQSLREEQLGPVAKGLAFDLERVARTAFALRIPILFVNYPVPYAVVNATIRTSG
jgi:hypothetical protein